MSKLSAVNFLIRICGAFAREPTQRQDELAKELDVQVPTLVGWLEEMKAEKVLPLEDSKEHRHIFWSVPKAFSIRGLVLPTALVDAFLRTVLLSPETAERSKLLEFAQQAMPNKVGPLLSSEHLILPQIPPLEAEMLDAVQAAIAKGRPLFIRYLSPSENADESSTRVISPQLIDIDTYRYVLAYCHRLKALKWFRLDRFLSARDDARSSKYVRPSDDDIEDFVEGSEDHFNEGGPKILCRFTIKKPTAGWASRRLMKRMKATFTKDGVDVEINTTALKIVARFILGLGADVEVHTPELKARCLAMAEASLGALKR